MGPDGPEDEVMTNDKQHDDHGKPDAHDSIVIHVDQNKRDAPKPVMNGSELRSLGPVAGNRTLWKVVPGGEDDLVEDLEPVELKNGMHFYSVAKTVGEG
jgi:hypothetical protein